MAAPPSGHEGGSHRLPRRCATAQRRRMRHPRRWALAAALCLLALAAGSGALAQEGAGDGGNGTAIVSCLEACDACATGLAPGDAVLASEFESCNTCGGVAWIVECGVSVRPAPSVEVKVKTRVAAGDVVALVGPYGLMADCNRNLLLVESRTHDDMPTGVWDVVEVWAVEGDEGDLQATLPAEDGGAESPVGPLSPGVVPSVNETIACSAQLE